MPVWKELLKLGKSTRGGDDAVSAMFDEIIKIRPDLKGALNYIKGEYKIGNISGEAAKRAANMAERSAGARGASISDRTGVKILGDYGTSRTSAREAMDNPAFEAIDERIRNFDLKGDKAVNAAERNARAKEARAADVVNDDYELFDKEAYKDFDDAFEKIRERELGGSSPENLERGWRRSQAGLEGNVIEDFNNAVKSGLSVQEAAEEVAKNSFDKYGYELEFNDVIETARKAGKID